MADRRHPGEGSVWQRDQSGEVRWVAQVSEGPRTARVITRRVFKTRDEAAAWVAANARPFDFERAFWEKVDKTGECWIWRGTRHARGYGSYGSRDRRSKAHRWAWRFTRGPIPEGMELDHLCRNPWCVNPGHLEPVSHAENVRRAAISRGTPKSLTGLETPTS